MGCKHTYCYECESAPCICGKLNLLTVGGLIILALACYGAYSLWQYFSA
jgi:hypothetical protein